MAQFTCLDGSPHFKRNISYEDNFCECYDKHRSAERTNGFDNICIWHEEKPRSSL